MSLRMPPAALWQQLAELFRSAAAGSSQSSHQGRDCTCSTCMAALVQTCNFLPARLALGHYVSQLAVGIATALPGAFDFAGAGGAQPFGQPSGQPQPPRVRAQAVAAKRLSLPARCRINHPSENSAFSCRRIVFLSRKSPQESSNEGA